MTYRSLKLATIDTFWWLVDSGTSLCWTLATVLSCGLVRRRRAPKVHAVAITPRNGSSPPPQLTAANVLEIDQGDDSAGGALALVGSKEQAIEPVETAA